jgi:hypothetical protein
MQYREIVAVTGLGGLFQLMATKSDGAIVRSLADNTTKFIPSRLHNVTPLESIEIYTHGNNVRLHEVLQKMKDSEMQRPDTKKAGAEEIRSYFKGVFPEMDEDRVYASDMKKMLKWFDILKGADLLDFSSMNTAATAPAAGADDDADNAGTMPAEGDAQVDEHARGGDATVPLIEEGEEKPAKKARAKKAAATEEGDSEKPAKKTARKKAEGDGGGDQAPKKAAKPKKKSEE